MKTNKISLIILIYSIFHINYLFAQNDCIRIQGIVKNNENELLQGAFILCKGINKFTYSDFQGEFVISLTRNEFNNTNYLLISLPGYITYRKNISPLSKKEKFTIILENESFLLNEVNISATKLYDGKKIIKKAFKNIKTAFINKDFISSVHYVQTVKEKNIIRKYREAYYSVFHKSGYSNLHNKNKVLEKVIQGQIRETEDYSTINFNAPLGYPIVEDKYYFFYNDDCKYKPYLIKNFNNYKCYIVDSIIDKDLILISCYQMQDTIQGKSKYKYKTDYLISVSIRSNIIRKINAFESFSYIGYVQKYKKKRTFSESTAMVYTNFKNNNYLKELNINFTDRVIVTDNQENLINDNAVNVNTIVFTSKVNINKIATKKNISKSIGYNNEFWSEMPLYYKKNLFDKTMFINGKLVYKDL